MLKDQVVSVTDLRKKTKDCLRDLEDSPKFIFANNRMVAVLLNVEEYESLTQPDLLELPAKHVTPEVKKLAKRAKSRPKNELLDL